MRARYIVPAFLLFIVVLLAGSPALATPDFAKQTGFECGACHVDVIGGGKLTAAGETFRAELQATGQYRQLTTTQHIVRLVIGYLHMLAAVIWFGTILYVHILLKPAYASKGLPRGELRLGFLSMTTLLATGTLLTIARMPNLAAFVHTRFGILLSIKICLFLLMVTSAVITARYIGPRLKKRLQSPLAAIVANELTVEQLAQFDGKDGRPAYFAYKGIVYSVTENRFWRKGTHMMKHQAGTDLTETLKLAPHGEEKVRALPQVGTLLASGERTTRPFHERLFYFFAYMNLALVFIIIFVISLWRWW
jgi:predicted heme/steroid binding protein/uncharacterized membrane protein